MLTFVYWGPPTIIINVKYIGDLDQIYVGMSTDYGSVGNYPVKRNETETLSDGKEAQETSGWSGALHCQKI